MRTKTPAEEIGKVYCPMCTHTVEAKVERRETIRRWMVTPGQKCSQCSASLDAGYIFLPRRAA